MKKKLYRASKHIKGTDYNYQMDIEVKNKKEVLKAIAKKGVETTGWDIIKL